MANWEAGSRAGLSGTGPLWLRNSARIRHSLARTRNCGLVALRIVSAVLGLTLASGCNENLPVQLRADDTPIYHIIGRNRFIFPANYVDSRSYDGALLIASWPKMEGRTSANGEEYRRNNIRILVSRGNQKSMQIVHRIHLLDESQDCEGDAVSMVLAERDAKQAGLPPPVPKCKETRSIPKYRGNEYDFVHSVINYDHKNAIRMGQSHKDVFVRSDAAGNFTSLMTCGGEPAEPGRNPQCELWTIYSEMPDLLFKISFGRRKNLHDVNRIEQAVLAKFLLFRANADHAFTTDLAVRE